MRTTEEQNALRTGTIVAFHSNFVIVRDDLERKRTLCTLRGRFKLTKTKPMVGDRVEYIVEKDRGRIESIMPRRIVLKRPKVANIGKAIIVMTRSSPDVPYGTVDRFIATALMAEVEIVLVLNKTDLTEKKKYDEFIRIYKPYRPLTTSVATGVGLDELERELMGSVSFFTGPSGVGKTSLLNAVLSTDYRVGKVSEAINFGRHTTTSVNLMELTGGGLIVDTPGFMTLEFSELEPLDVKKLFPEIEDAAEGCAFDDCVHDAEPGCQVKRLVESGEIAGSRYESYIEILKETRNSERLR